MNFRLTPKAITTRSEGLAVKSAVEASPYWSLVRALLLKHGGTPYIVGGKVYRTLAAFEHGVSFHARDADWDFYVIGGNHKCVSPPFISWAGTGGKPDDSRLTWVQTRGVGVILEELREQVLNESCGLYDKSLRSSPKVSMSRTYELRTSSGKVVTKVDIIYEEDIITEYPDSKLRGLDLYFKKVPLDVQAVAVTLDGELLGPGVEAIRKKQITVNNPTKTVRGADINRYAMAKTKDFQQNGFDIVLFRPKNVFWRVLGWLKSLLTRRG